MIFESDFSKIPDSQEIQDALKELVQTLCSFCGYMGHIGKACPYKNFARNYVLKNPGFL